jgi:hypothetical protein
MKSIIYLSMSLMVLLSSCTSKDGWTELFNGKDFTGFNELNGKAPFRMEDGVLIGTSVKDQPSSFMATQQEYSDFILEFDVLCDTLLNSGVQFRSESKPDYNNGRVHGYQCEIDPSDRAWSGGIYDEARRGWLVTLTDNEDGRKAYRKNDWNNYRIECLVDTIRIWLNGVNTAHLLDNTTRQGFIAFQIHSIGKDDAKDGKEIKWKNIRIKTDNIQNALTKGDLTAQVNRIPNSLTSSENAQGWRLLFDGVTTQGWRSAFGDSFPAKGWKVEDGAITVLHSDGAESTNGGDIVTNDEFSAFELSLEFKITEGANSGVKYFVADAKKHVGSAYGLEYQILDDRTHPDAKLFTTFEGSRKCAGLYDLIAPKNIRFNGTGQWNLAVIKVFPDDRVEHWLNGFKTVEYVRCSAQFRELVKGSKYAAKNYNENGAFGESPKGHILLQDHGNEVSFRSIKIKVSEL